LAAPQLAHSTPPSDEELVRAVLAGDAQAFEVIYERYFKRIYQFVDRRLSNRADTEETVQEVFFNVFSSLAGYRGDAPFGAWVFGLTRRTIAGRFKRKRLPMVPLLEADQDGASRTSAHSEPTPLEAYECEERLQQLEETVANGLSKEQRKLFELHHLQDRSISEIAAELEKSEDAVKSNLYRTRKLLLAR